MCGSVTNFIKSNVTAANLIWHTMHKPLKPLTFVVEVMNEKQGVLFAEEGIHGLDL